VHLFARDTLHGWPIWLACHFHDYGYLQGGTWADRRRVDHEFALNIVLVCRTRSWPRAALVALLYWLGVRLGGWGAFSYRDDEKPVAKLEAARERLCLFRRRK